MLTPEERLARKKARAKDYYQRHREAINAKSRAYYAANAERCKEANRARWPKHAAACAARATERRKQNPDARNARARAIYAKSRERYREAARRRYLANRERDRPNEAENRRKHASKKAAQTKRWLAKNPERLAIYRLRSDAKRSACPVHRLHKRVASGVRRLLLSNGLKKAARTESAVGWTVAELRAHLELQFLPGMTWGNMAEWHIDHIVPLVAFEVVGADCQEFKRAWALSNLRPLWAKENLIKNAKREFLI